MLAISWPGPVEVILLLLMIVIPTAVVLVVLVVLRAQRRPERPAFPVIPHAEADGPGTYRVIGVDKATRADRQLTIEAGSRANAQVKAELDGIIVTSVVK